MSNNRVIGFATGAVVTGIVQSSSATTVMLISFVSAGLMTLQQAGVILGCNVRMTMTAQPTFKVVGPGPAGHRYRRASQAAFCTRKKYRCFGEVVLGFGLLFFGMTVMGDGLKPLRTDLRSSPSSPSST